MSTPLWKVFATAALVFLGAVVTIFALVGLAIH